MEEIIPNNILKVSHISASYQEGKQRKTVLHDISFELHENEILGLVGESGCGKSTLSKVILGFIRPDEGEIFSQVDHPQMIFQDPFSSLNPAKKISWILEEPLRMQKVPKEERKKALKHLLDTDMGHEKCRILKPSVLPETGIHLEVLSDYSVFLCFLSEKDTFLCIYLKETSIGQALNDYLCSLSEEESVYTKKEARQILLGLLEQL